MSVEISAGTLRTYLNACFITLSMCLSLLVLFWCGLYPVALGLGATVQIPLSEIHANGTGCHITIRNAANFTVLSAANFSLVQPFQTLCFESGNYLLTEPVTVTVSNTAFVGLGKGK